MKGNLLPLIRGARPPLCRAVCELDHELISSTALNLVCIHDKNPQTSAIAFFVRVGSGGCGHDRYSQKVLAFMPESILLKLCNMRAIYGNEHARE